MTRKMILIAGVAGLALSAPGLADKGGHGRGGGGGEAPQQAQQQAAPQPQPQQRQQQRQAQQQRAERPQMQQMQRPQRVERQAQEMQRPQQIERQVQQMQQRPQHVERQAQPMERPQRIERQAQQMQRPRQIERQAERGQGRAMPNFDRLQGKVERRMAERNVAMPSRGETRFDTRALRPTAPLFATREMRPMKAFKQRFADRQTVSIGQRTAQIGSLAPVPAFYANNYVDTPDFYYRYDDRLGSVYRIERNNGIVRSLIPLFGGYNAGSPWPSTYYNSYVPAAYQDYYYDTPDYYYRNDGYGIYQVDSQTQLITALVALLTGQGFGVGQLLPASYDAYNIPLDYRDHYADDGDSWYRYGDGYIYQVDPGSRRIAARYPVYADQYAYDVGQPWPVAYPDYNVPYAYRSDYYDTPQDQYRYADGAIYQVDPTTQVIRSLMALLSGGQFAIGQPMPAGYDTYNVPFDYRDRYADSDRDWYRYANGSIYQIDPSSGLIEQAYPV